MAVSPERKISVVVPVYNERENIAACLRGLWKALQHVPHEILVCYDFEEDTTLVGIREMGDAPPSLRLVKNNRGRGAANALRAGFDAAKGDVVVTTMGDLSDPPENIPKMAELMRRDNLAVVSGSRYMPGGSQSGGPLLKRTLSRWAGISLNWIAGVGTKDATSNFRAYSKEFLNHAWDEEKTGFEIALELTVKAHLKGQGVGEVPSTWTDRTAGESRFRLWAWMPNYLRWWFKAAWRPLLVGLVALFMSVNLLHYVHTNSSPFPMWDDLEYVPLIQPDFHWTAKESWALHNEHRIPLPRWVGSSIYGMTHDIRTVMFVNASLLIALAFAMMLVARKVRGQTSLVDVLFPCLWLHTGNAENLLMGFQIALILPTVMVSIVLMIAIAKKRVGFSALEALAIGMCVLTLPLSGGMGMAQAPVFVLAMLLAAVIALRRRELRFGSAVAVLCAAGTIALFFVYLHGFVYPDNSQRSTDPNLILGLATRVGSLSLGKAGEEWWPYSGWSIVALVLATTALLVWAWFKRRDERWRIGALIVCLGATVALLLSIGFGRGGGGTGAGFALRYITLPAPVLSTAAFAWIMFGNRVTRWLVPGVIATALAIAAWTVNARIGADFAFVRKQMGEDLMADVHAGMPPGQLVQRWVGSDRIHNDEGRLYYILRFMAQMNLKPFDDMPAEARELYTWGMFNLPPMKVESPVPVSRRIINGNVEALVVPTGTEITFDVPQAFTRLEGWYGVPVAWQRIMKSSGARVQVLAFFGPDAERKVLLEKRLDPLHVPEDRGGHFFDVPLEPLARIRRVVLSVSWPEDVPPDLQETDWVFFSNTNFR